MKRIILIISALLSVSCLVAQPSNMWLEPYFTPLQRCNVMKEWIPSGFSIAACADTVNNQKALVQVPCATMSNLQCLMLDSAIDTVMDICIVGNEVFFCGSATRGGVSVGYVGHTSVSLGGFTPADFVTFDSTSFICKLVVYTNPNAPAHKVVAIGRRPYTAALDYDRQFIIELDHSGAAFMPTTWPAYFIANPSDYDVPEHITVTDDYVAISGHKINTDGYYFIIRCDKRYPAQTAQIYDFQDPNFISHISAPTIEHIDRDYVAVAYFSPRWDPYRIVVKTVNLSTMMDDYSQYFNVGIWNTSPDMAFMIYNKQLVLLTTDTTANDTLSYFVYAKPFATSGYASIRAFPRYVKRVNSISRLGVVHFMGHSTDCWYLQNSNDLLYGSYECMDRTDIIIQPFMKMSGVISQLNLNKLYDGGSLSSSNSNYSIKVSCPPQPEPQFSDMEDDCQNNKPISLE